MRKVNQGFTSQNQCTGICDPWAKARRFQHVLSVVMHAVWNANRLSDDFEQALCSRCRRREVAEPDTLLHRFYTCADNAASLEKRVLLNIKKLHGSGTYADLSNHTHSWPS